MAGPDYDSLAEDMHMEAVIWPWLDDPNCQDFDTQEINFDVTEEF